MAENIPTLLAADAAKLSNSIYGVLGKGRITLANPASFRVAHDIAVRLHLISGYITSIPPYWVGSDVEDLCHLLLHDFGTITRPKPGSTGSSYFSFSLGRGETNPDECLVNFFKVHTDLAQRMKITCDKLYDKLTKDENDVDSMPDAATQHWETQEDLIDFDYGLFEAIEIVTECNPSLHQITSMVCIEDQDSQATRHIARLCLHEARINQQSMPRSINMLVSARDTKFWQEFYLM